VASDAILLDAQGNDVTANYEITYVDGAPTATPIIDNRYEPDPNPWPVIPNPMPDPLPTPDFVSIDDPSVPLANLPKEEEEEYIIVDEEIPQGNLPKTGSVANAGAGLIGAFAALASLAAASITLLKKKED